MTAPNPIFSGHCEGVNEEALLKTLETLNLSGTLLFESGEESLFLLLHEGLMSARYSLAHNSALGGQRYAFEPHVPGLLPEFGSRYPDSLLEPLRALPKLGPGERLPATALDLRPIIRNLGSTRFTGLLSVAGEGLHGLMFLHDGSISAAFYEAGVAFKAQVKSGEDALRAVAKASLGKRGEVLALELRSLPPQLLLSLLGLALKLQGGEGDGSFSGIEVSEGGYTYYEEGQAYLFVPAQGGDVGFYSASRQSPNLKLPDEPPGWENQRYGLTLRGRDAMNPMTDLSVRFNSEFGKMGRQVLQRLASSESVEEVAGALELALGQLKPLVDKLAAQGLVREADDEVTEEV